MNMKKLIAVGALLPLAALAEEPAAVAEEQAQEINADVTVELTARESMQQMFDEFAQSKGDFAYGLRDRKTGKVYFCAQATVSASPTSNMFIQQRQVAFDKAFDEILGKFVAYRTGENVTETATRLFSDDSSDVLDTPKSLEEASKGVLKKIKVAGEAALDKGLRSLGVDPGKYDGKPLEAKRVTYAESLMKESAVRALGSAVGVSVVKTMEAHSPDGVYVIGVIAKYDPVIEDVARCIAREVRPSVAPRKGISAASLVNRPAEVLAQNFGVRFYYNEAGEPEVIAFGQWASGYTGKDVRKADRKQAVAASHAESAALQMLTEFIGGCYSYEDSSSRGSQVEEANVFDENGGIREGSFDKLAAVYRRASATRGRARMRGRDKVLAKDIRHPAGQKIAFCAVRYSFDVLDAAKDDGRQKAPEKKAAAPRDEAQGTAGTAEGDTYDF